PVADWIGDPAKIVDYQVRFTRPVPVDAADGATVTVTATVGAVDADTVRIDLTVVTGGATVLGKARATVRVN
ncbi:MAG TPA: acyl dehydratase, partial [Mycobacterium sp.]|nr:acyl dehydratase [Mycobacterium sp.]